MASGLHLLDGVRVVVEAPLRPVAEGVEDDPAGLGLGPDEVEDRCHRHPAPPRHPGPSLDAEVLADLLVVGQRPDLGQAQLHRMLDQAVDAEAVVGEA
jgi:hypothetical protein